MADEENKEGEAEGGGGGGKGKLIMIIAGVLVLAGGGGAAFMFMGGGDSAEEAPAEGEAAEGEGSEEAAPEGEGSDGEAADGEAAETGPAEAEKKEDTVSGDDDDEEPTRPNIEFGETYKLADFHLNLGNPLENHYMTMSISLEYRNGEQQEQEIILREPQIRDAVISVVTRKTREFLLSPDGKAQLRLEMLNRINQYMDKKIEAVYFNEFMVE